MVTRVADLETGHELAAMIATRYEIASVATLPIPGDGMAVFIPNPGPDLLQTIMIYSAGALDAIARRTTGRDSDGDKVSRV